MSAPKTSPKLKHALLLQGPVGPFFQRFAKELQGRGVAVSKVNFNGGDHCFYRGKGTICYREPLEQWPEYFRKLVRERGIDAIFLVGDCRIIHKPIIPIAQELGIAVWVFEEGYLRPDHITLERNGVNGNSPMSKDPEFYRQFAATAKPIKTNSVGKTFLPFALQSILYTFGVFISSWRYPHYQHHRDLRAFRQTFAWLRSGWRKRAYARKERGLFERATSEWSGKYFLVPLQLHCDFQIVHSDYKDIPHFIKDVVTTFAEHAPADTRLLIKHHPLDRAYRDYTKLLAQLCRQCNIADRVHYIHDQHLPTLLEHARGVVTMNSTVGTSALLHNAPVKVMGRSIYNIPELTYQGSLGQFFQETNTVDSELFSAFTTWLLHNNQYNGSFYRQSEHNHPERDLCRRLTDSP